MRHFTRFSALALAAATAFGQVTTSQYDNARTGADLHETILTPRNVNSTTFGKVFTLPVDGDIYAAAPHAEAVQKFYTTHSIPI